MTYITNHKKRRPAGLLLLVMLALIGIMLTSCKEKDDVSFNVSQLEESSEAFSAMSLINPDSEIRGVWIASVYNINYPSQTDLSAEQLQAELDAILDTCEECSLNTIFIQVRPASDALYDSDIFPVSKYLSSSGTLTFDPLDYLVNEGHQRNIYVYAWVNPLRATTSEAEISTLPSSSPAAQHPEWTVQYADGKLYYNAGVPEVQELIADGVGEIVTKYDVDGVVFDDYFYPYPSYNDDGTVAEFDDSEQYAEFHGIYDNIEDWRRNNVNTILSLCYEKVHEIDSECVFGVSPSGIWRNNDGTNGGSDTWGFEAYNTIYSDAVAWLNGGYIDFIAPQIYWDFETTGEQYDTVLRWWNAVMDGCVSMAGNPIKLYVSHAAYKYDGTWSDPTGELTEQIEYARSEKNYRGSIMYGYAAINENQSGCADDLIKAYEDDIIYSDVATNNRAVVLTSPADGAMMSDANTYIMGSCDPYYPLTMNGEKVCLTKSGYFSEYVTLSWGKNEFVFEQNGEQYTYILYYGSYGEDAEEDSSETDTAGAELDKTDDRIRLDTMSVTTAYPSFDLIISQDSLWVQCVAPYDSDSVTAAIGDYTAELVRISNYESSETDDGTIIGAVWGKTVQFEGFDLTSADVLDCGKIFFRAVCGDEEYTAEGGNVILKGSDGKLAVRTLSDYTGLKYETNSSVYNDYTDQSAGMTDYITGLWNGFYHLEMGGYMAEDDCELITDESEMPASPSVISAVTVSMTEDKKQTEIRIMTSDHPAYYGTVSDGNFVLTLYNISAPSAPEPIIISNPLFTGCEVERLNESDKVRYSFSLADTENFYGFDLRYEDGVTIVTLKNPVSLDFTSETPLDGIKIVLDAGHGGWDNGAAGFISTMNEKDVNLAIVLQAAELLRSLGADVYLTREDDTYLTLDERMTIIKEIYPDLTISVHQNSMPYTSNITTIRGTLSKYCMDSGLLLSECIGESVSSALNRLYRGSEYQMLAMCRNPKFPQCLVEVGFITSAEEYELMTEGGGIEKCAQALCDGVIEYYTRQAQYLD